MTHAIPGKNRLNHESSPYLRQHAGNPVDWSPWDAEALERAASEQKPIFLSIGYSACHWCHVMEHESFENAEIAEFLNEHFVSIKVDREERPDLDAVYMNAVMAMTGGGGWPMSVFLTPDRRPFFGGTYWPPRSMRGMPGFLDILRHVDHAWRARRDEVERAAGDLLAAISTLGEPMGEPQILDEALLLEAGRSLLAAADRQNGGFGRAPKFPSALSLRVLLRYWQRTHDPEGLEIVTQTLDRMARGGMYDQLGGGFHRYSTDAEWLVPHFEKMLYDQALLVPAYLEAWQATGNDEFAKIVRETLDYVRREMTAPHGGFFSTQDADTEGVEGKFFIWSAEEIEKILDPDDAALVKRVYGVSDGGNWEGVNILHRPDNWENLAAGAGISQTELVERAEKSRARLLEKRAERIAPPLDDKQLVSWNGLMIATFARSGFALDEADYLLAAAEAAEFILDRMRDESGNLLHTFRDGQARLPAYLDDYAALADGLAELYQATGEQRWLTESVALVEQMIERFSAPDGGLYFAPDENELIVRQQDSQDNATPSGNGLAAMVLIRLGYLTDRADFTERGVRLLERVSGQIASAAIASGQSLLALDLWLGPTQEIVITGDQNQRRRFQQTLSKHFLPRAVILPLESETAAESMPESLRELVAGKLGNSAAAYVCEGGTCQLPARTPEELRERLGMGESLE